MRTSNSRISLSIALALAAGSCAGAASAQTTTEPAAPLVDLPSEPGCYHQTGDLWQRVDCDTPEYIKQHIPHPELILGVAENELQDKSPSPFKAATVRVNFTDFQSEIDIDRNTSAPEAGTNSYSIQANVFFTGDNGVADGVQFTNQAQPVPGAYANNICIWQIDIITQDYGDPTCLTVLKPYIINQVTGVANNGVLVLAFPYGGGGQDAIVSSDEYHLGHGDRFSNVSGTVLGLGNGSEAFFEGTSVIATTTVEAATCLHGDPLVQTAGPLAVCTSGEKLDARAAAIVSPGSATHGSSTVETNNLEPVTGNPLSHLPTASFPNDWAVEIEYAATTTGKCPTGAPPLCK